MNYAIITVNKLCRLLNMKAHDYSTSIQKGKTENCCTFEVSLICMVGFRPDMNI